MKRRKKLKERKMLQSGGFIGGFSLWHLQNFSHIREETSGILAIISLKKYRNPNWGEKYDKNIFVNFNCILVCRYDLACFYSKKLI